MLQGHRQKSRMKLCTTYIFIAYIKGASIFNETSHSTFYVFSFYVETASILQINGLDLQPIKRLFQSFLYDIK